VAGGLQYDESVLERPRVGALVDPVELQWTTAGRMALYGLLGRFRVGRMANPGVILVGRVGAWARTMGRSGSVGAMGGLGAEEEGCSGSYRCFWAARTDSRLTGGG
jgi:hypothetical protein